MTSFSAERVIYLPGKKQLRIIIELIDGKSYNEELIDDVETVKMKDSNVSVTATAGSPVKVHYNPARPRAEIRAIARTKGHWLIRS